MEPQGAWRKPALPIFAAILVLFDPCTFAKRFGSISDSFSPSSLKVWEDMCI